MYSRGKLLVSLCARNDENHVTAENETGPDFICRENNINSNQAITAFPSTSGNEKYETEYGSEREAESEFDSGTEYVPEPEQEENSDSSGSSEPLAEKRKRWRRSKPETWKRNITKKRRSSGMPYLSKSIIKPAKIPKNINCENCKFKCTSKFTEEQRKSICLDYWKLGYLRQKDFILSCVSSCLPKVRRVRTGTGNKKESSRKYHLKKDGETIQVCKKFFLQTLCISHGPVDHALNGKNENGLFDLPDKRGKKTPRNKTPNELIEKVKAHISSFPTMESHYCRKSTKRLYLDSKLSISKMYELYVEQCIENGEKYVSQITYRRTFCNNYNLAFYKPNKDQCEICAQLKNKTISEEDYNEHMRRRDEANAAKNFDKLRAIDDKSFLSASFDLQSILQIPCSDVSQMYYSLKLCAYNFTIYEAAPPNNAYCYAWTEINGQRGSSEIGTALFKWIQAIPKNVKEISLYSDTCSGQNRNQFIAALFMYVVQYTHIEVLQHNFMEKGHSYMEVDSMHSAIESAKKNTAIYTMNDLLNIFKMARSKRLRNKKSNSYHVEELRYQDFLDLKALASVFLKNRSKDDRGDKVSWLKIKVMRYEKHKPGCILFKYNYSQPEYNVLRVYGRGRPADIPQNIPPLYKGLLPIPEKKKKNSLLKLCSSNVIPPEYQAWYRSLPVDKKKKVTVPEPDSSETDTAESSD